MQGHITICFPENEYKILRESLSCCKNLLIILENIEGDAKFNYDDLFDGIDIIDLEYFISNYLISPSDIVEANLVYKFKDKMLPLYKFAKILGIESLIYKAGKIISSDIVSAIDKSDTKYNILQISSPKNFIKVKRRKDEYEIDLEDTTDNYSCECLCDCSLEDFCEFCDA